MLRLAVIVLVLVGIVGFLAALFMRKVAVPTISTEKLRELQRESESMGEPKLVLIDVRSPEELAVSMIPGAITAAQFEEDEDAYRGSTIVTYCTVGVRSEHYARKLLAAGHKAVNFEDSIIGWCEANFPLVTPDGEPTNRVHTYSDDYKVPAEYRAVY